MCGRKKEPRSESVECTTGGKLGEEPWGSQLWEGFLTAAVVEEQGWVMDLLGHSQQGRSQKAGEAIE